MADNPVANIEGRMIVAQGLSRTGTGRKLSHDPRSKSYAHQRKLTTLKNVRHQIFALALDQDWSNMCTGYAAAQFLNSVAAKHNRSRINRFVFKDYYFGDEIAPRGRPRNRYLGNADAVWLYGQGTQHDSFDWTYPPTDEGGSGLGIAKALKAIGVIDRYEWAFDFESMLGALSRQPVLIGTYWPESMFYPDIDGNLYITGQIDETGYAHEYLGVGIDKSRNAIRIRNSWGGEWGINGDAYIGIPDMMNLLAAQGDCVVPLVV